MLTNLLLAMAMASPSGGVPASGSGAVSSPGSMVPASRLEFVENRGQWPSEARFMAELGGMTLWLTESGSVMDVHSLSEVSPVLTGSDGGRATRLRRGHIVRSEFVGSDGKPVAGSVAGVGESRSETVRHYYLGNDPSRHPLAARRVRTRLWRSPRVWPVPGSGRPLVRRRWQHPVRPSSRSRSRPVADPSQTPGCGPGVRHPGRRPAPGHLAGSRVRAGLGDLSGPTVRTAPGGGFVPLARRRHGGICGRRSRPNPRTRHRSPVVG